MLSQRGGVALKNRQPILCAQQVSKGLGQIGRGVFDFTGKRVTVSFKRSVAIAKQDQRLCEHFLVLGVFKESDHGHDFRV